MSLMKFLVPWGHNLELERKLAEVEQDLARERLVSKELSRMCDEYRRDAELNHRIALSNAQDLSRLRLKLRTAHFRNPATGRLGPQGVTYN